MIINNKMPSSEKKEITDKNKILKDTRIIIFFSYLILVTMLFYITLKIFQNKRKPLEISSETFALFENETTRPENTFLDLGVTTYDKIKHEVDVLNSLKYCNEGQCAMDLKSGLKRCAESNIKIMINPQYEVCVDLNSCPDVRRFAVQNSGETDLNSCEGQTPCRCLDKKLCAAHTTEMLKTTNGNPWIEEKGYKNFKITPYVQDNEEGFNLEPIVIEPDNLSTDYCKINPQFSQRLVNGCNFSTNGGEPMDCNSGSYLTSVISDIEYDVYSFNYDFDENSVNVTTLNPSTFSEDNTFLYIHILDGSWVPESEWLSKNIIKPNPKKFSQPYIGDGEKGGLPLPPSGAFIFNSGGTEYSFTYERVIYTEVSHEVSIVVTYGPADVKIVRRIYTNPVVKLINTYYNGKPGLPPELKTLPKLRLASFVSANCIKSASPSDNYKNMLNCVQTSFQPCISGQFAYNVDKGKPRQFAQFNNEKRYPKRNLKNYLLDPSIYTMSCVAGGGCSKVIDLTLCEGENCTPAVEEKKSRFFSEFDDSAVSSQWLLFPPDILVANGYSQNYTKFDRNTNKLTLNLSDSLLTIENGDYWSTSTDPLSESYITKPFDKDDNKVVILNDVSKVRKNMEAIFNNQKRLTVDDVDLDTNQVTFKEVIWDDTEEFPEPKIFDIFLFYTAINTINFGVITECKIVNNNLNCILSDIKYSRTISFVTEELYLIIYKQFGFNGINYNTVTSFNSRMELDEKFIYRNYTENSIINIANNGFKEGPFFEKFREISPPLGYTDFIEKTNDYKKVFNDPFASFKRNNTMYYPIWNDDTFKQECVIPLPFLVAYPVIDEGYSLEGAISRISIQFSGKHFSHYFNYENKFCYNLFTKLKPVTRLTDTRSSYKNLILDKPNPDISIGNILNDSNCGFDVYFELDPDLNNPEDIENIPEKLNVTIVENFNFIFENNSSKSIFFNEKVQLDDRYRSIKYQGVEYVDTFSEIVKKGSRYIFSPNQSRVPKNYFVGKLYAGGGEIIPGSSSKKVYFFRFKSNSKVISINNNNIITNKPSFKKISENTLIQILNPEENLEIGFGSIYLENFPGENCDFEVDSIIQGRITNIKINNYGKNYLNDNKPLVEIKKYKLKNN